MSQDIIFKPIGIIKTPFKTPDDLKVPPFRPESPYNNMEITGVIEVFEEYCEGIANIEPGTQGLVLFYLDKSPGYKLTTISHRTNKEVGVFSTRSPHRPNGIGVTIVNFISVEKCKIKFQGVDMLDDSPLLDIKPYRSKSPRD